MSKYCAVPLRVPVRVTVLSNSTAAAAAADWRDTGTLDPVYEYALHQNRDREFCLKRIASICDKRSLRRIFGCSCGLDDAEVQQPKESNRFGEIVSKELVDIGDEIKRELRR